MKIQIHDLKNFSESEVLKIKTALINGSEVLNSGIFEASMLDAKFTENKGMSSKEILELIRLGKDGKDKTSDGDIDIHLTGYCKRSRTIGYTYLNHYRTWLNKYHLAKMSPDRIFGHILHEYCHRLGFRHEYEKSTSVPYLVGKICKQSYKRYYTYKPDSLAVSAINIKEEKKVIFKFAS